MLGGGGVEGAEGINKVYYGKFAINDDYLEICLK